MIPTLKPLVKPASMNNVGSDWIELHQEIKKSAIKLADLSEEVKKIGDSAGDSKALQKAIVHIKQALSQNLDLTTVIDSSLYIRALGSVALELGAKMPLNQRLFNHIDAIRDKPSVIFLESLYQHYLRHYDKLVDFYAVKDWLLSALDKRNQAAWHDLHILSSGGAKWFANQCITQEREFNNYVAYIGLDRYQAGRFLTVAQQIYYVERLRDIPVNKPHPLLEEVQKQSVYMAPYDQNGLLGHEILKILISRAPVNDVDDSWRNVVMQIAGDPRIPKSHLRYQKWWLHLDDKLQQKVIGWLSALDLRLFLEALEDYSKQSGNDELFRMYPARKRFLEGLLHQKLVTRTRLYLPHGFRSYLNRRYKKEHLPELYSVNTNDKSIIHVELGHAHLIEGSHSARLWVYRKLTEQAIIFNYQKKSVSYRDLTAGLAEKMYDEDGQRLLVDSITHHPALSWQNKALGAMKKAGVKISPEDVLTESDYFEYKRKFGVTLLVQLNSFFVPYSRKMFLPSIINGKLIQKDSLFSYPRPAQKKSNKARLTYGSPTSI